MSILKKAVVTFILLGFTFNMSSQNELNSYKYIIVPKQFDFLKKENQYRVNSYTKYLFDQEGFIAFYQGDDYPADLVSNPCLATTVDVINESSAFTTKLFIVLKDCRNETVLQTIEGRSKIKEYDKTYIDALKKSFVTIRDLNYDFDDGSRIQVAEASVAEGDKDERKAIPVAAAVSGSSSEEKARQQEATTNLNPSEPEPLTEVQDDNVQPLDKPSAATAVVASKPIPEKKGPEVARSYGNKNITFMLIKQGEKLLAYVTKSAGGKYKPGELIGTFEPTSLPKVFRVNWTQPEKNTESTTGYFDDAGNLKVDIHRDGKLEVLSFSEVHE